jgi:hypothetical protein
MAARSSHDRVPPVSGFSMRIITPLLPRLGMSLKASVKLGITGAVFSLLRAFSQRSERIIFPTPRVMEAFGAGLFEKIKSFFLIFCAI